jgi:hypothetical protein
VNGRRHNANSLTDPSGRPAIFKEVCVKRAMLLGVFAAIVATAWTFLAAQQGPSRPSPTPPLQTDRDAPLPAHPPEPVAVVPAAASPLSPLQQRFIELSTKKANSLNAEQLQKAVNELNEEVEGLNAWSKVDEGARVLRDVADKSPQTAAGRAAKAALRIIEQYRSAIEPVPDPERGAVPGFQRGNSQPPSDSEGAPAPPASKKEPASFDTPFGAPAPKG